MTETSENLAKLPLDGWHRARGGRMVPFAGYEMPVQYEGIMAEHLWIARACRPVRCQPYGPAAVPRPRHRPGAGDAAARRPDRPEGRAAALFDAAGRGRRDHRRSDGDPARRAFLPGRQRRHQAWRYRAVRAAPAAHHRHGPYEGAGAAGAAGPGGGRGAGSTGAGRWRAELHAGRPVPLERQAAVDQPVGLYRRGRVRDFGRGPRRRGAGRCADRRRAGQADRPWRARFAAARGRPAALWPRPRLRRPRR